MAQIVIDNKPERSRGSEQLTFVVPAPLTGTTAPDTTVWESSLQLAIGIQAIAAQPLPVVYEPNGSYLGSMSAPVTMVEYGDYQCPFCGSFYVNTWPALKSEYVDTGKVRFQFQDMAFLGPDSTLAAEGAHCAGDQYRFWEYHDYLYAHQGLENSGWASTAQLNQFASELGLDTTQFAACLNSAKYLQEVQNETAAGHQQNINATPGFLINGTILMGAQPLASFEQVINAALQP
jgi:protein-disulfide isomerase